MTTVAVTGASGFIGGRLIATLIEQGHQVRALVRRDPPNIPGVRWIKGDLADAAALQQLIEGADAVVHGAGAVKALSAAGFHAANALGTATIAEIAAARPTPPRFIHLSSFAAREPKVSVYAASKAAAESAVLRLGNAMDVRVLRPPAVYGPGDREALRVLQMASRGFVLAPGHHAARLSLVHVDDAVAAILTALSAPVFPTSPVEFDDGMPGGHGWPDIARAASDALRRPVRVVQVPGPILYTAGAAMTLGARLMRRPSVLSLDKVGEALHPDWVVATPPPPGYRARWTLAEGFRNTAEWAASRGLVRLLR